MWSKLCIVLDCFEVNTWGQHPSTNASIKCVDIKCKFKLVTGLLLHELTRKSARIKSKVLIVCCWSISAALLLVAKFGRHMYGDAFHYAIFRIVWAFAISIMIIDAHVASITYGQLGGVVYLVWAGLAVFVSENDAGICF